jgi:hypothetical protein
MTQDEIIDMAREAGLGLYLAPNWALHEELELFAKLVATHEREACAKVCDAEADSAGSNGRKDASAANCATAIRARGNK